MKTAAEGTVEGLKKVKSLGDLYTPPKEPTWTNDLIRQALLPGYQFTAGYHITKRKLKKRREKREKAKDENKNEDESKDAAYVQGFMAKCAEHGVDPEALVKHAARGARIVALLKRLGLLGGKLGKSVDMTHHTGGFRVADLIRNKVTGARPTQGLLGATRPYLDKLDDVVGADREILSGQTSLARLIRGIR